MVTKKRDHGLKDSSADPGAAAAAVTPFRPMHLEEGLTTQAQVYAEFRRVLMSGSLRPGEELSLRQLAAALGVSTTPIREALRQLETEGGLEIHGGNRVYRVPVIGAEELSEIRDIRVQLEGMATESAAGAIRPAQMRLITNAYDLMCRAVETNDVDLYLENNWRFHSLIYQAARRPTLLGIIERLWLRTGPLVRLAISKAGRLDQSMELHAAALEGLQARDRRAAREAIIRDITEAARDLTGLLDTTKKGSGRSSS